MQFSIIYRTFSSWWGGFYPSAGDAIHVFLAPSTGVSSLHSAQSYFSLRKQIHQINTVSKTEGERRKKRERGGEKERERGVRKKEREKERESEWGEKRERGKKEKERVRERERERERESEQIIKFIIKFI